MDENVEKWQGPHEVSSGDVLSTDTIPPEHNDLKDFGAVTASGDALQTSPTSDEVSLVVATNAELVVGDCGSTPPALIVQSPVAETELEASSMDKDTFEIRVLLRDAVDTVVRLEQGALLSKENAEDIQLDETTARDQSCDTEKEAICTYSVVVVEEEDEEEPGEEDNEGDEDADDNDDFGDFGDFSGPPQADNPQSDEVPSVHVTNGPEKLTTPQGEPGDGENKEDVDDIDDDFGDFDQATFDEASTEGFANFDAALPLANAPACFTSRAEDVRPLSVAAFGETINKLFTAEDPIEVGQLHSNKNSITDEDYAEFTSKVQRDVAHCENVDEWPCVVFRYDNSVTRKALLKALCVDETPVNFPRFAMDCLSKAFLQPVKQAGGGAGVEGHHNRVTEPNSSAGAEAGAQGGLSNAAKEVLNKIPDLSFMKAEVLTFPTVSQASLGIDL